MSDKEFQAGGRHFNLSKIDTFKQFHIVRRIGPILGDIIPVAQKLHSLQKVQSKSPSEEDTFSEIADLAKPIMDGLSKLSDADANYVLLGLLSAVEVRQMPANNWAKVVKNDMLMIGDLGLPLMLQIAGRAFAYNLADFFAIAPQTSHGGA